MTGRCRLLIQLLIVSLSTGSLFFLMKASANEPSLSVQQFSEPPSNQRQEQSPLNAQQDNALTALQKQLSELEQRKVFLTNEQKNNEQYLETLAVQKTGTPDSPRSFSGQAE